MKILISISAIPLNKVFKHVVPLMSKWDRHKYDDLFTSFQSSLIPIHKQNKDRIFIPLDHSLDSIDLIPPVVVQQEVEKAGYTIINYASKLAVNNLTNKLHKIGGLLKSPEAIKAFANDPQLRGSRQVKRWIVISRHPYDLAGMSFKRGWKSCMNVEEGINKKYIKNDIQYGTIVAYLITDSDLNDKTKDALVSPIARVLLKPYYSLTHDRKDYALFPSVVYGDAPASFLNHVTKICDEYNKSKGFKVGAYKMHHALYTDHPVTENQLGLNDGIRVISDTNSELEYLTHLSVSREDLVKYIAMYEDKNDLEVLNELKAWHDPKTRIAVMHDSNVSEALLILGSLDEDPRVRLAVANAIYYDKSDKPLVTLSDDISESVREAVMQNAFTSATLLLKGAKDESAKVRWAAIRNRNSTREILKLGTKDENEEIRKLATILIHARRF